MCSVCRIDLEAGVNINANPGREEKSLMMRYQLSFTLEGVHSSNKQNFSILLYQVDSGLRIFLNFHNIMKEFQAKI